MCKTKYKKVCFLAVNNFNDLIAINKYAKLYLNEILHAIEFLDQSTIQCVLKYISNCKYPFNNTEFYPFYLLIETAGSNEKRNNEKMDDFLNFLFEKKLINNGVIALDGEQELNLWNIRENAAVAAVSHGYVYKYDISLPLHHMYQIVEDMRIKLNKIATKDDDLNVIGYGHLGDGNLHLNILTKTYNDQIFHNIEPYIFEKVSSLKGSISAEHGIGHSKRQYLYLAKGQHEIQMMKQIKNLFDPNHILNPYKVLPDNIDEK